FKEQRDEQVEKLRDKFASKAETLQERLRKAEQAVERESQQAKQKKMAAIVSVGTAILSSVLGRRKISATSASRMGTAIKGVGTAGKEAGDIARAEENVEAIEQQIEEIDVDMQEAIDAVDTKLNIDDEKFTEIVIRPKSTDIHVHFVGLVWLPFQTQQVTTTQAAW
ncbi:MAG: ATP-binding protein, partial [Gammaproteobacteria bacterium]|nr:ATP-binding protein [Gammaproteobacteria bacterium]